MHPMLMTMFAEGRTTELQNSAERAPPPPPPRSGSPRRFAALPRRATRGRARLNAARTPDKWA